LQFAQGIVERRLVHELAVGRGLVDDLLRGADRLGRN